MKAAQLFIIFLIFSIIFNPFASAVVVDTNVFTPTDFATMQTVAASPVVLESKILIAGETSTMTTSLDDGKISISDSVHTFREVSMDYQMLIDELDGFNGHQIALTHMNDAGEIDYRRVVSVSPDVNGYVSVIMEFSTTIVDGFVGTTTTILTGLSGNQSISVPDGSSCDFNITNNQHGTWTINGTDFSKRLLWTLNTTSENLTDFQVRRVTPFDSNMQADMDDRQLTYYENDTLISFWDEEVVNSVDAIGYIKVPKTSTNEQQRYWLYYNNSSASSVSSIGDVMLFGDDFDTDKSKWTGDTAQLTISGSTGLFNAGGTTSKHIYSTSSFTLPYIIESSMKRPANAVNRISNFGLVITNEADMAKLHYDWGINNQARFEKDDGGRQEINTNISVNVAQKNKMVGESSSSIRWYFDDVEGLNSPYTNSAHIITAAAPISYEVRGTVDYELYWVFARKYTTTEPTWVADGEEQTATRILNITASVTGDNNTQSYNTSQSREFTLTPTGTTNNVSINTTSTDYNVTVTTYWTEDTIKHTETVENGYANITVQYTPSNNITEGVINATYNIIDFSAHDYTGVLSVFVDDVDYSSNGTRLLNDVNTTIIDFDTSTHYINFSVPYNPAVDLYSPNDTATLSYAYPPLTHDVVLSWEQSTGTYKYTVVDYDTGAVISSSTVSSNTTTVALSSGQYKWYVNGYDDVFNEYSQISIIRSFTVEDTFSYPNDTVVHGVVYEYISGVQTPLDTALVNIWNNTWSSSSMTGTNGYFLFQGLHNSTYSMRATKDGYIDSNIELVTPTFNTTLTRDILLQSSSGAGQQYVDHYVKFTVKSLLGTLYAGVEVNVYLGDAVIPTYIGTTGTDGSISFELNEYQEYRITFISTLWNIDEERTLYPKESEYSIIVFGANLIPDDPASSDILFGCYGQSINLTHGYINVSFEDTSGTTALAELWINDTNMTNLYYFNTTDNDKTWSQVVDGGNASYVVVFKLNNTVLNEPLVITRTIKFDDTVNVNLGLDEGWKYQLIAVIIISVIALLGSALNAEKMAVITVLVGWLMVFFGWLQAGATIPEQITLGLMMLFATLIAFGSVIRKGDER